MRMMMTLIVFAMASVTVAGAFITVALAAPELGLIEPFTILTVALAGFLVALPVSYVIAGRILAAAEPKKH